MKGNREECREVLGKNREFKMREKQRALCFENEEAFGKQKREDIDLMNRFGNERRFDCDL